MNTALTQWLTCSVPHLKVYLSWKSRSSVGVPQLEVSVLLRGIALSVILAIDVVSLWSFSWIYRLRAHNRLARNVCHKFNRGERQSSHSSISSGVYSLDKIQLLRIMPSYFLQMEFPVVSGHQTISKYRSLVHMSSYIGTFFMWNQISACNFIFTWPEKLYPFLSAIYLDLVSYMMEPTSTGQGKCHLSSQFHLKLINGI
jgi:hypothetical protein